MTKKEKIKKIREWNKNNSKSFSVLNKAFIIAIRNFVEFKEVLQDLKEKNSKKDWL